MTKTNLIAESLAAIVSLRFVVLDRATTLEILNEIGEYEIVAFRLALAAALLLHLFNFFRGGMGSRGEGQRKNKTAKNKKTRK